MVPGALTSFVPRGGEGRGGLVAYLADTAILYNDSHSITRLRTCAIDQAGVSQHQSAHQTPPAMYLAILICYNPLGPFPTYRGILCTLPANPAIVRYAHHRPSPSAGCGWYSSFSLL